MIRIGIVGTENSHALAFAKYFNLPDENGCMRYDNIRVTAIAGDEADNVRICEAVPIAFATDNYMELLGKVDAVMITSRRGSVHFAQAKPFLECGLPLFIDKPFTTDVHEALLLEKQISQFDGLVVGGSGCKLAPQITELKSKAAALRRKADLLSASMAFTSIADSPYDGFWFYAPHLVEMALAVFGGNPVSVAARRHDHGVLAELRYAQDSVVLHFDERLTDASCTLYTSAGTQFTKIDISGIYAAEAGQFAQMLLLHRNVPSRDVPISAHVVVIAAILKSIQSEGQPVDICSKTINAENKNAIVQTA